MAEYLMAPGCAVRPSTRMIAAIFRAPVLVLLAATVAHAQSAAVNSNPLPYSKGFLVTGDYVAAGVDLTPQANPAVNGIATGTISISGVPANADIVGAFLYWEELFVYNPPANPAAGVKFNGSILSPTNTKVSSFRLSSNPATCWGAAGSPNAFVAEYRSDVLYLLPKRFDVNHLWTGKYLANGQYTVSLPQISGNGAVESSGATLVLVYRDPSLPLKKVLLFDGAYAQPEGTTMLQALRGFYKSGAPSASVTFAVGTGGNNQTEAVLFNNTVVSTTDPFPQTSPSSDRSWATTTYGPNVLGPLMALNKNNGDGYGETATVSITANPSPQACRTVAAIVFSTTVADVDHDGIPDGIEDVDPAFGRTTNDPPTVANPAGAVLPNLNAMGASSSHPDIFIEINAMYATPNTQYGSAAAPFNSTTTTVLDAAGHNHMPTPDVIKMVGDVYAAHGIVAHFDVGDPTAYHNLGPQYACADASCNNYLVPTAYARGGEEIQERACSNANPAKTVNCEFDAFPGTVGWKLGFEFYRNAPVADDGSELTVAQINDPVNPWKNGSRRRRFDRIRQDYFHYVLYAHARGKPKSKFPCLDSGGNPVGYAADGTCNASAGLGNNPSYHVPLSVSGVADLPGNSVLITLGLWDNFVGTPFVIASTTLHELGHNLNLWHGGPPAVWGDATTPTVVEPNCKPNYLSSMNYMFQVHGLFDNAGAIHLDYSGSAQSSLDENGLVDTSLAPAPPAYVPAWFAPSGSTLALSLGVSPATRFCNGVRFSTDPAVPVPSSMARVFAPSTTAPVDWNGDGIVNAAGPQNANYDATPTGFEIINSSLNGYNDWANIRLDQLGAGRSETKISDGNFTNLGSGDVLDFGSGDMLDFGSGDFIDLGSGDILDFGSGNYLDFGNGNFLDTTAPGTDSTSGDFIDLGSGDILDFGSGDILDFGSGDILDFGSGDILDFGSGSESQEIDYDKVRSSGRAAPFGLNGCVISLTGCLQVPKSDPTYLHVQLNWAAPTFGRVTSYQIFRKKGTATSSGSYTQIGTSSTTTFVDLTNLSPGQQYTYYVRAVITDELPNNITGRSNLFTITYANK